ncbi:hypothetical protein JTB14_007311 [Gonioctena quinquepunctata]|nr:hypothetical protein JTB14_007311 [Gonioctena quinquepunctata]
MVLTDTNTIRSAVVSKGNLFRQLIYRQDVRAYTFIIIQTGLTRCPAPQPTIWLSPQMPHQRCHVPKIVGWHRTKERNYHVITCATQSSIDAHVVAKTHRMMYEVVSVRSKMLKSIV